MNRSLPEAPQNGTDEFADPVAFIEEAAAVHGIVLRPAPEAVTLRASDRAAVEARIAAVVATFRTRPDPRRDWPVPAGPHNPTYCRLCSESLVNLAEYMYYCCCRMSCARCRLKYQQACPYCRAEPPTAPADIVQSLRLRSDGSDDEAEDDDEAKAKLVAKTVLADILENGRFGLERDVGAAALMHLGASRLGSVESTMRLAVLYETGNGVRGGANVDIALALSGRAAASANFKALNAHATRLIDFGLIGEAHSFYKRAARQGYAYAMASVGYMYCVGFGVEADLLEGRRWLGDAFAGLTAVVEAGDPLAEPERAARVRRWLDRSDKRWHKTWKTGARIVFADGPFHWGPRA